MSFLCASSLSSTPPMQVFLMQSSIMLALILITISPLEGYNIDSRRRLTDASDDIQKCQGIRQHEVHYIGRVSRKLKAKFDSIRVETHVDKQKQLNVSESHVVQTPSSKKPKIMKKNSQYSGPSVDQPEAFRVDYNRAKTHPPKNN